MMTKSKGWPWKGGWLTLPAERRVRAFSLIELLITMALILILFVMLHSHGSGSYQRKQLTACERNLQTLHLALEIYANDHEGALPAKPGAASSEPVLSDLVPRYTSVTAPFICPGSKHRPLPEGESFAERQISYAYYMGRRLTNSEAVILSDAQVNTKSKNKGEPVFSLSGEGPGSNHNKFGGNFLLGDGHVESSRAKAPFPLPIEPGVVLLNPKL